jgi:hypothetical protein
MSGPNRREGIAFIISLMLVVIVYSNVMISNEYIIESNNPALTSQLDNTPELHAVSDWGGLGSTSACQVHDSDQSVDENTGSSATFQMSETPSSSTTCYLGINLQYNYKVVNGSMIKPSYFDIEIEYSRSMPFEENCAWFSILAVNGHSNPAQGNVIENYYEDQNGDNYWIGSSSCNGGPGDQRAPLPSSPITTDMRDDASHLQGYSNSQYSGFTVEIIVNPWYEPQFNMYIKEVRIIPSNTCLNDADCDGISDSEEDDDDDGVPNIEDDCENTQNGQFVDEFGCSDYQRDSDNDGVADANDQCENTPVTEITNVNTFGCSPSEWDSDLDGYFDNEDMFPLDVSEWEDTDNDNIGNNADLDDDGDGWLDEIENQCQTNQLSEMSIPKDTDDDGQCDYIDDDDDGDGILDTLEIYCGSDPLDDWSLPYDFDFDGICDLQDNDDDNDGYENVNDSFPLDNSEWADTDNNGIGDNTDTDDDGDGWLDEMEITCMNAGGIGDPKNANIQPIDNETETGPDGLYGTNDDIILGDGLCNAIDQDDDNDGYNDEEDRFDWDPAEWFDYDLDGIGDNTDTDDDGDGWLDEIEIQCQTNQFSEMSIPRDTDNDEECDYIDDDDDGDGVNDINDQCPDSIDIENINSVGCGKDDVGVFQNLSDTLIGRIGTSWQMLAFGVMILCFVGAAQIVRPRKKNIEIDEKFDVGDEVLEKVVAKERRDSIWSELRYSPRLHHRTKFGEIYVRRLTEYHSDYIDNRKFSNSKEREIVTTLLRHAVEVEENFRSKSKGKWDEGVGEKSAAVIIKRLNQRRGKKENKKSLFDEWGWTEAKIPNPEGHILILNRTIHGEDDHDVNIEWTNNYSEVLADLIKAIIIGAKLKK